MYRNSSSSVKEQLKQDIDIGRKKYYKNDKTINKLEAK